MKRKFCSIAISFSLLVAAMPVLAHHSLVAEFDPSKEVVIKGVVTKVDWINPHIYLHVDVKDENGQVTNWSIETFPTGFLHKAGITKDMLGIDQEVAITIFPAKDGSKGLGFLRKIVFADGHVVEIH